MSRDAELRLELRRGCAGTENCPHRVKSLISLRNRRGVRAVRAVSGMGPPMRGWGCVREGVRQPTYIYLYIVVYIYMGVLCPHARTAGTFDERNRLLSLCGLFLVPAHPWSFWRCKSTWMQGKSACAGRGKVPAHPLFISSWRNQEGLYPHIY